jgi:hypothetical protein
VKVWEVELFPGANTFCASAKELDNVIAAVEDAEVGDKIKIKVREMSEEEYANLPEWDGP